MKKILKLVLFFIVVFNTILTIGCFKEKHQSFQVNLKDLAKDYFSHDLSTTEMEQVIKSYKSLNHEEFKDFLVFQRKEEEIIIKALGLNLENFREITNDVVTYRDLLLKVSISEFGKPYNQLNNKETSLIIKKATKKLGLQKIAQQNKTNCDGYSYTNINVMITNDPSIPAVANYNFGRIFPKGNPPFDEPDPAWIGGCPIREILFEESCEFVTPITASSIMAYNNGDITDFFVRRNTDTFVGGFPNIMNVYFDPFIFQHQYECPLAKN